MRKILIAVAFAGVVAAVALGARERFLEDAEVTGAEVAGAADAGDLLAPGTTGADRAVRVDSISSAEVAVATSAGGAGTGADGGTEAEETDAAAGDVALDGELETDATDASAGDVAPAGEPETDELLRATAAAYASLHSMRADFAQRLENPLLGKETTSRGTLFQRRPDRFLLRFTEPEGDIIVSDGRSIWVYYPSIDAEQVVRARASAGGAGGMDLQAQFVGDPVERFDAERHAAASVDGRKAYVVTLTPTVPAGYESLKVWIDARDHLVRRFEIHERSGLVRHFELSDLALNPELPDRLFEFEPPAGATIIERG